MSYILEALKKAQAERQLGDTPGIHAAQAVHAAPRAAAANRKPLLVGLAAGALLASAAAFVALRHQAPAPASAPAVLSAATAERGAVPVAAPPAAAPAIVVAEPAPAAAVVVPAVAAPASVRAAHPRAPAPARAAAPDVVLERASTPAAMRAGGPAPDAAVPAAAAVPSSADDNVRPLAELPEAIQREVPKVAFGGYIYSANPSDRLLLVDKTLRHEGEQVAPGLVLEKLLPKAAVMNYRGYRYRVAY